MLRQNEEMNGHNATTNTTRIRKKSTMISNTPNTIVCDSAATRKLATADSSQFTGYCSAFRNEHTVTPSGNVCVPNSVYSEKRKE